MESVLLEEIVNDIAILTINRPKAYNSINADVMQSINGWFSEGYKKHTGLKGVVLKGSGEKAFVAGADIKQFTDITDPNNNLSKYGHDTFNLVERFHLPVVAAINGFTLGGGCELAMSCHIRVATENSKFGQPEVNLGLVPGYGGSQRLIQLIGKGKAIELLLTADMIKADEAHRLGLVNKVVPVEELLETATGYIEKIATKGPKSIAKTIELVNAYFDKDTDGFKAEYECFADLLVGEETKEGVAAFIEKRPANFKRD